MFERPEEGHLSAFKVSRLASGAVSESERVTFDAHLATCEHCRERVRLERVDVDAAKVEPMPARLLSVRPRKPWWSKWQLWVPGLVAAAAAIAIVVAPKSVVDDGIRTKGKIGIEATVSRGDAIAVADVPLAEVGELHAGDRLLLKVRGGEGQYARVESFESGAWVEVHKSVVPAEGWLALALKVTPGETKLRVTVCPDEASKDCFEQTQTLEVK